MINAQVSNWILCVSFQRNYKLFFASTACVETGIECITSLLRIDKPYQKQIIFFNKNILNDHITSPLSEPRIE